MTGAYQKTGCKEHVSGVIKSRYGTNTVLNGKIILLLKNQF